MTLGDGRSGEGAGTAQPDIQPRRVRFSWEDTPLHWVPGDPFTSHLIDTFSLLLPAGERWFVHVFKQALPLITDDRLRQEVKGFMGQEGTHAVAHQRYLEAMKEKGLDPVPFVENVEWIFERLLGDHAPPPMISKELWLEERLAVIAAIEHFTAVLGGWIIERSQALDRAGADPVVLDLLRWHGAEEVEHRSVAFDLYMHIDGSPFRRARAMAMFLPGFVFLLDRGTRYLMNNDPIVAGRLKARWTHFFRRAGQGRLPRLRDMLLAAPRYMRPGFHPSQEGSLEAALHYIAVSPAHREYQKFAENRARSVPEHPVPKETTS